MLPDLARIVIDGESHVYPELARNRAFILTEIEKEESQFEKTLQSGMKEFEKLLPNLLRNPSGIIPGRVAFRLYDTYGFPVEFTTELAREHGLDVDIEGYGQALEKHRELSRAGLDRKFGGGLADHSDMVTKLHTATHLLHKALREVLGDHVEQRGSNITHERLRFDFSHPAPMTADEIEEVTRRVNAAIEADLAVTFIEKTVEEAEEMGAIGLFKARYGEVVKVYRIGDYSMEICGARTSRGPGDGQIRHTVREEFLPGRQEDTGSAGMRHSSLLQGLCTMLILTGAACSSEMPDFGGRWETTYGPMTLTQEGDRVTGLYVMGGTCTVEGEGERLRTADLHLCRTLRDRRGLVRTLRRRHEDLGAVACHWLDRLGLVGGFQERGGVEGTKWLVILEAEWQTGMSEPEYSFGEMLATFFARVGNVRVRQRFIHDRSDLEKFALEAAALPGSVYMLLSCHATEDGIALADEILDGRAIAAALSPAATSPCFTSRAVSSWGRHTRADHVLAPRLERRLHHLRLHEERGLGGERDNRVPLPRLHAREGYGSCFGREGGAGHN